MRCGRTQPCTDDAITAWPCLMRASLSCAFGRPPNRRFVLHDSPHATEPDHALPAVSTWRKTHGGASYSKAGASKIFAPLTPGARVIPFGLTGHREMALSSLRFA